MEFSAQQIADMISGQLQGNPHVKVQSISRIEEGLVNSLSFLANPKYTPFLYSTNASIVIISYQLKLEKPVKDTCTLIRVNDPYSAFAQILKYYDASREEKKGVEQPCVLSATASFGQNCYIGSFSYVGQHVKIGNNVKIYPQCYIGDYVSIADNTVIYAGVKVYSQTQIGAHCTIHSGAVIGSDGFGFVPNQENIYSKVPQLGNVIIEDHVEIGANTTVDRATIGSTVILKGVKLDNLIQVAHNVEIGENTVIAAQTGIAGSTKIGKNCMIGGQVGFNGHIKIAENVKIAAQSGVISNVEKSGEVIQGTPGFNTGEFKRSFVLFKKLPELFTRLTNLEKKISE